jgi:hypothetical protein
MTRPRMVSGPRALGAGEIMERGTPPRQAQAWVLTAVAAFYRGHWDDVLTALDVAAQLPLDALYRQSLGGAAAQVAVHRDDRAAADRLLGGAGDIELVEGDARIQFECLLVAWALAAERDDIYTDLRAEWDIMRADARLRQHNVRRGTRGTCRRGGAAPGTGGAAGASWCWRCGMMACSGRDGDGCLTAAPA